MILFFLILKSNSWNRERALVFSREGRWQFNKSWRLNHDSFCTFCLTTHWHKSINILVALPHSCTICCITSKQQFFPYFSFSYRLAILCPFLINSTQFRYGWFKQRSALKILCITKKFWLNGSIVVNESARLQLLGVLGGEETEKLE